MTIQRIILFSAFIVIVFALKSFMVPSSIDEIQQPVINKEATEKPRAHLQLGLISKKQITKNVIDTATVWEEVHRVKGGLVTIRSSVQEVFPEQFKTTYNVKHENLKGEVIYSRIASNHSNSISIYRYKKDGPRKPAIEIFETIEFKEAPSEGCLKNRYQISEMPERCDATVTILSVGKTLRLKFNSFVASLYSSQGKLEKIMEASESEYISEISNHLHNISKDSLLIAPLREPTL